MHRFLLPLLSLACAPVVGTVEPVGDPIVDEDPLPADDPWEWTATVLIGGLDRVVVVGARDESPRCIQLWLVWPGWGSDRFPDLNMPEDWGVEFAGVNDDLCDPERGPEPPLTPITSMSGSITFDDAYPPQALSLDVIAAAQDWGPEALSAEVVIDDR